MDRERRDLALDNATLTRRVSRTEDGRAPQSCNPGSLRARVAFQRSTASAAWAERHSARGPVDVAAADPLGHSSCTIRPRRRPFVPRGRQSATSARVKSGCDWARRSVSTPPFGFGRHSSPDSRGSPASYGTGNRRTSLLRRWRGIQVGVTPIQWRDSAPLPRRAAINPSRARVVKDGRRFGSAQGRAACDQRGRRRSDALMEQSSARNGDGGADSGVHDRR